MKNIYVHTYNLYVYFVPNKDVYIQYLHTILYKRLELALFI